MKKAFEIGKGVILTPQHYDHCISCGQYEDRRIVYTGQTGLFPIHFGDGLPICDKCVQEEFEISCRNK